MDLSPRQLEVAQLISEGLTDKEIAKRMGISYWTVHAMMHSIRARTGMNRIQLAVAHVRGELKARAAGA